MPSARAPRNGADAVPYALLVARDLTKRFGRVVALEGASLTARAGEVTCLVGDNGAGKSTLIKIFAGVHQPTSGQFFLDGAEVGFRTPRDALDHGIATVHQDLAVVPLMSVWRNFFLGREAARGWGPLRRIQVERCREIARAQLGLVGIEVGDPDRLVGTLSGGERQALAIARALHAGARVLIFDEPTAALGVRPSARVLERVRDAAKRGVAVILVTHNPHHAHAVADRFVVLRRGRAIADRPRHELSVDGLVELMGREESPGSSGERAIGA